MYATDASSYRQVPIGVVIPGTSDDVIATVRLCREHGAPILCRGGGTSLAGQCCNTAVVLDFTKYMGAVLEVNAEERWARVEPGTVLDRPPGASPASTASPSDPTPPPTPTARWAG
jgi:FAD/FMN-containing dehydrogenase